MEANQFIGLLLYSRDAMHLRHWETTSLFEHEALGEYYEGILPLIDDFAEDFFAIKGRKKITILEVESEESVPHLKEVMSMIEAERKNYNSALQNILDEMIGLISKTLYRLTLKN